MALELASLRAVAHQLDLSIDRWVHAVGAEARPLLDDGGGLWVYAHGIDGACIALGAVAGLGTSEPLWGELSAWGARHASPIAAIYRAHAAEPLSLASLGPRVEDLRASFEGHGVADMLVIVAHTPEGAGVVLTAPRRRRVVLGRVERRTYARLASELAALVCLRRQRAGARRAARALSRAEHGVAALLARGFADKEIAEALGVGTSTVSTLARRVRAKLACRPGEEALRLLSVDDPGSASRRRAIFERLTSSEQDVAARLVGGASLGEIASLRGSCLRTVAVQSTSIYRKAGVSGRRELAAAVFGGRTPRRETDYGERSARSAS